jgi:D-arabinose 1-dehydrogenase-like Zn-dependent alcohol dehydrogenase
VDHWEFLVKAAVLTAPGRIESVDDWPEPVCGPHDVVVEIDGVGLCGSDLTVFHGKRRPPELPWISIRDTDRSGHA